MLVVQVWQTAKLVQGSTPCYSTPAPYPCSLSCLCALQENVARLNVHHLALFNTEQTHLWLAFWCDFFGAVLVVATALLSVAFSADLGGANVGLAISNSIQVWRDGPSLPTCTVGSVLITWLKFTYCPRYFTHSRVPQNCAWIDNSQK